MRGKLPLKIILLFVCGIIVIYSVFTIDGYLIRILVTFIGMSLVPYFILLMRNVKMPDWLFKNRFFWFYPTIILFAFSIIGGLNAIINLELPPFDKALICFVIALLSGFVWGAIERFRENKYLSKESLCETVDLVTEDFDTVDRGVLVKNQNHHFTFKKKGETIFEFNNTDIKTVSIQKEYKLFPIMLKVELYNGEKYDFDSQFPFVWKKLLIS